MKRFLFFFFLFLLVFLFRLAAVNDLNLPKNARVRIRGQVQTEPAVIGSNQVFKINNVRIKTRRFPEYHFGDSLDLVGRIEVRAINRFIKEYWLIYPEIQVQSSHQRRVDKFKVQSERRDLNLLSKILREIYQIRGHVQETYNKNLPEPFSSLLAGVVLGIKSQLPRDFFQVLKVTGTLHVVVASGMNLTFFAPKIIDWFSGIFHRFLLIFVSLLFILIYCAMLGFEPPIVRAAMMVTLSYLAAFLGRRKDGVVALFLSAAVMLIFNPLLLWSLSFQLSFAATSGIIFLEPFFRRKDERLEGEGRKEKEGWLRPLWGLFTEDFRTTLSAQIGVWPLLMANFGEVSVFSLLVNALSLWTIPYLMGSGLVLALAGLVFPGLTFFAALAAWPFLFWFVRVVEFFGRLPLASMQAAKVPYWVVLIYYLVVGYIVGRKWRLRNNQI